MTSLRRPIWRRARTDSPLGKIKLEISVRGSRRTKACDETEGGLFGSYKRKLEKSVLGKSFNTLLKKMISIIHPPTEVLELSPSSHFKSRRSLRI